MVIVLRFRAVGHGYCSGIQVSGTCYCVEILGNGAWLFY
jgi:hypothetical protein